MSDHLPECQEDWPEDPFGLLGIDPDADAKTARLAYANLIRRFKPEHSPEGFQKIRSAYEGARSLISIRDEYGLDLTAEPPESRDEDAPGESADRIEEASSDDIVVEVDGTGETAEEASRTATDVEDVGSSRIWARFRTTDVEEASPEIKDAWEVAKDGQLEEARSRLETLLEAEPDNDDVIVRLYWVRRLGGDASIDLIKWLFGVAARAECQGTPWQILMTELDINPGASRLPEADALLAAAPPERLTVLLALRWKSAGRSMQWESIERDLETVRPSFAGDYSHEWAGLLVVALRCLVWRKLDGEDHPDKLFESLVAELNGFQELHLQVPQYFDEVDELLELRTEIVRDDHQIPSLVLRAIREDTLSPEPVLRKTLIRIADEWAGSPSITLLNLEHLASIRPVLFGRLWQCLARYNSVSPEPPEEHLETLGHLVAAFVATTNWNSDAWRMDVVDFCTRECLAVETIVKLVLSSPDIPADFANGLAHHLYSDAPLRCLTEGLQMLQSV